jgi:hypothetical protein
MHNMDKAQKRAAFLKKNGRGGKKKGRGNEKA